MKSILSSRWFWSLYTLVYFVSMVVACVIAEGHMMGGGGNSDTTVWSFEWHWSSLAELNTIYMVCFLLVLIFPWLSAAFNPPQKQLYLKLLSIHLVPSLLLAVIYIGGVLYGLLADVDSHFDDWWGEGIYPSPIDEWTSVILFVFCGPLAFIYGLIVTLVGIISNKK